MVMELHAHLPYRLAKLSLRIKNATTDRYVWHTGMSAREWRVLGMLGIVGSRMPSELADLTGMDRATISRATSRLVHLGYVSRLPNQADNRSQTIELTPAGEAYCQAIVPRMEHSGEECRSLFSAGEFALFIEFLDRMDAAIADGKIFMDGAQDS
ncbi:MAG: hypothetical protein APF82_09245 [Sphingomonadales bacterium BRH_c42]|nr:MAG: hypothetical protein APF82_09245 [Sphingomonadales bacterium BRH_c42]